MSNVQRFRDLLLEQNLDLQEGRNDDDTIFFRTEQKLKHGGSIVLVVAFSQDESLVDIYGFNVAQMTDPLKRDSTYKLLNDLNRDFRFNKFTMTSEGIVDVNSALVFENNFDPNIILRMLIMTVNTAEEAYPKFMKLLWA